jgi:DNA-binding NarL/FixJ family response regulator
MPRKHITIAIVDDSPIDRELLAHFVKSYKQCSVIFYATNGEDLLFKLHIYSPPDIIILDMYMPTMDGWETLENLDRRSSSKILCVSNGYYPNMIKRLKEMHVSGYSRKKKDSLDKALKALLNNDTYFDEIHKEHQNAEEYPKLRFAFSGKEIEILNYLSQGLNYQEISEQISYLSPKTIELYVQAIVTRCHLKNKIQLITYAYFTGQLNSFNTFENFIQSNQNQI